MPSRTSHKLDRPPQPPGPGPRPPPTVLAGVAMQLVLGVGQGLGRLTPLTDPSDRPLTYINIVSVASA